MKKLNIYKFIILGLICYNISCNNPNHRLDYSLNHAGENRGELERVLDHYKEIDDSVKYLSAVFLIENMVSNYYASANESLFPIMDSLNRSSLDTDSVYKVFDSIRSSYPITTSGRIFDIQNLSAEFLIRHIDRSVEIWRTSPWYNKVSFDVFCEYILPYSVGNEKREFYLDRYRNKYSFYLSDYLSMADSISLTDFCENINLRWISDSKIKLYHDGLDNYPPLFVDNIRSGTCDNYGARTVYILRSLGVPVAVDFSPQWINFSRPHSWNVLIDEKGKSHPFLGFDETIEDWHIEPTFNCPKIFRNTFSINPESLKEKAVNESIPGFLNSRHIKDVTKIYFDVSDVSLTLDKTRSSVSKFAYLYVFNNSQWIPVHWGEIKDSKVTFKDMGRGVVYLPAYFSEGKMEPAAPPFILDSLGNVTQIITDMSILQKVKLERKYYTVKVNEYPKRLIGGRFQGSNDPEFRTAKDLYLIEESPKITFNEIDISEKKSFKYVRYIGGKGSFGNIAEVEFYSKINGEHVKLLGETVIGTAGTFGDKADRKKENVFDGDVLTFFDAPQADGAWVGLKLPSNAEISKIRYLPRNDDNNIRIGDLYRLVYWSDKGWVSLGQKRAKNEYIEFEDCPAGALFLLRNLTRGKEERIFMLENGEQVWW